MQSVNTIRKHQRLILSLFVGTSDLLRKVQVFAAWVIFPHCWVQVHAVQLEFLSVFPSLLIHPSVQLFCPDPNTSCSSPSFSSSRRPTRPTFDLSKLHLELWCHHRPPILGDRNKTQAGKRMKEALSCVKINWRRQWDRASPSFASIHGRSHRSPSDVSLHRVKWLLRSQ